VNFRTLLQTIRRFFCLPNCRLRVLIEPIALLDPVLYLSPSLSTSFPFPPPSQ
jgi:hypothetical protein